MIRPRTIVVVCLFLLISPALALGLAHHPEAASPPRDLIRLLPPDTHVLAMAASLEDLDARIAWLLEDPDDPDAAAFSLVDSLTARLGDLSGCIDFDAPMALAMPISPMLMSLGPAVTVVVRWRGDDEEIEPVMYRLGFLVHERAGDFVAFSMDPGYAPADETPDLAADFPLHLESARFDLESIVAAFRPFVEMGLQSLAVSAANRAEPGVDAPTSAIPQMSPREAELLIELARDLLGSLDRLDIILDDRSGDITLGCTTEMFPESPFAPRPLSDLDRALELGAFLPRGGDMAFVTAPTTFDDYDLYLEYSRLSTLKAETEMDEESAELLRAWIEDYLELAPLQQRPLAGTFDFEDESWACDMIIASDDARGDLRRIARVLNTFPELDIGVTLRPNETDDDDLFSWRLEIDPEKFAEIAEADAPALPSKQLTPEQIAYLMSRLAPDIHLAAKDDCLLLSIASDDGGIEEMSKAVGRGQGKLDKRIAEAKKRVGDDCRQIVVGDLRPLLAWISAFVNEADTGGEKLELTLDRPLPFTQILRADDTGWGSTIRMPDEALRALVRDLGNLD